MATKPGKAAGPYCPDAGDIVWLDFSPILGHEQNGHRPALVLSPRVVLADEPTGQLDAHAASMVTELLVELAAESGGMLVVVTHAEAVAARVGTVRHLIDGRLVP